MSCQAATHRILICARLDESYLHFFFFSFRILTLILSSGRAFAIDFLQGIFASLKPCSGSTSSPLSQRLQVRQKREKKERNNQTYKLDLDRLLLFLSFCTASLQAWPCWVPPASPIATRRCATIWLDLIFSPSPFSRKQQIALGTGGTNLWCQA